MSPDEIGAALGSAFRRLRKRVGTQEEFERRAGIAQSHVSALERGRGWGSIANVAAALRRVGVDPGELLALAAGDVVLSPDDTELLDLWHGTDDRIRDAVLTLLRNQQRRSSHERGR